MCGEPVFLARWNQKNFIKAAKNILKTTNYDLVHLDSLGMAKYVKLCKSTPTVISTTDANSRAYKLGGKAISFIISKAYYQVFAFWWIARFERKYLPLFNIVHVVSTHDRDYLRLNVPKANIECIEHVVPEDVLQYPITNIRLSKDRKKRLLFTGKLSSNSIYKGLLMFLSVDFPKILKECSDIEIVILGGNANAKIGKKIRNVSGARYIEWVDDYCGEISKANVVVFTDWSGTGVKTRVLYSLALGKAIVASPVSLEGIDVQDGVHCYKREVGNGFAQAVVTLLNNYELQKVMGDNARRLIIDRYNSEISGKKWLKLYKGAIID
jgi:glycosyltransferase involved in cell wall biosynthesis